MAANDEPNRIDQVFADGRSIDEALIAAAGDAIEAHRRAGVPVVVARDGRIEHVSAEALIPDIATLVMDAEFETERTAKDGTAWFEERQSAIRRCLTAPEPVALRQGRRFKRFSEELYPFTLWLRHVYADREDVVGALNSGPNADPSYDAVVRDRATDPPTVTYVELTTTTFDRRELLNRTNF